VLSCYSIAIIPGVVNADTASDGYPVASRSVNEYSYTLDTFPVIC